MRKVVVLTGAGISAESGLGTFRDAGGLWSEYALEDVATPEGFARDPGLVHRFYNARRANAAGARPNAAHRALARLEADWPGEVVLITQNVDDLHERAGSRSVLHMHGTLSGALCAACGHRWPAPVEMAPDDPCPACGRAATRPAVVWFGEIPQGLEDCERHLSVASVFLAIGTSGSVWPAAGFVELARAAGARTVELTLDRSEVSHRFDLLRHGRATETVPAAVADMLAGRLG